MRGLEEAAGHPDDQGGVPAVEGGGEAGVDGGEQVEIANASLMTALARPGRRTPPSQGEGGDPQVQERLVRFVVVVAAVVAVVSVVVVAPVGGAGAQGRSPSSWS